MNTFGKFDRSPSKDRFARMVTDALRQAGETAKVHYDRTEFSLRSEGKGQRIFWLTNVYKEFCAAGPEQRQALLRNFVRSWLVPEHSVPESFEDVNPDLLPAVRARGYFEVTLLQLKADGHDTDERPYRPLAEHLAVGLVYDLPGAILQLGQHHLDGWKVTFEDAYRAACDNMRDMTKEPFKEGIPGVWASPYLDNHDASRLVLTERVRECRVRGDPVVLVPNRDVLLVTGSDDPAGLLAAATLAEAALDKPRFLTGIPVRLVGDEWVQYVPPPEHPARARLHRLRAHTVGRDYANQTEALKSLYEKTGEDVFVASSSLLSKKDSGEVMSYCVWSDGVDSLLPETDVVYFFRMKEGDEDGEIVANAPWERVRQVVGDLMKPVGLYPERYRVATFPAAEQLAALGKSLPL